MYQEVAKRAGHFGLYQKRTIAALYLSCLFSASTVMLCSVFVMYTPPHRCYLPEIDGVNSTQYVLPAVANNQNSSSQAEIDLAKYIPIETGLDGKQKWSQCTRYNDSMKGNKSSAANRTIINCDSGWRYFAPEGVLSATMEFDLVCDQSWLVPIAPSIQMFGVMGGGILGGYLSDRYGRRFAILLSWASLFLSFLLIAVMPIWKITYLLWFLMGVGFVIRATAAMVLINEVSPNKHRHSAGTGAAVSSAICFMLIPVMNYFILNWRYFMGVYAGLQALAAIPIYLWVNDSLKWLIQNEKYDQAHDTLRTIARVNKKREVNLPSNAVEMKKLVENPERKPSKRKLSYIDFAKISFLRRRLIIFGIAWFASIMAFYGLSLNTNNLGGDRYIACFITGAVELPGYLLCYITMTKFGGRISYMLTTGTSGLCLLLTPLLLNGEAIGVIVCSMVGKLFISSSFTNLYLFTGDLFPTLLRNQSYGATSFLARWAGVLVPFILYLGEIFHEAIPYLVMGTIAILATTSMFFLPETKKTPMPDTMEDAKLQDRNGTAISNCKGRSNLFSYHPGKSQSKN